MIETHTTFTRLVRAQQIVDPFETINLFIEYWHNASDVTEDLASFLGFTQYEYNLWIKHPSKLLEILNGEFI